MTLYLACCFFLLLLTYGKTQSNSSSSSPTSSPTNGTDDFLNQLKYIYIIAGVILLLILIVIVLLAAVCLIWQRKSSHGTTDTERGKRQTSQTSRQQQQSPNETAINMSLSSTPKKKTDNTKPRVHEHKKPPESVMTDFPLLCRVLQDYDSPQHNSQQSSPSGSLSANYRIRVPSENSSDIEASIRTTTSYLSESADYDELDSIVNVLRVEGSSSPKSPLKSLSKPKSLPVTSAKPLGSVEEESQEAVDAFGYHQITIKKEHEGGMAKSHSTSDMFDDPKYEQLPQSMCSPTHSLDIDHHSFPANRNSTNHDTNSLPQLRSSPLHSTAVPVPDTSFEKKDMKKYMSLEQVLELVDTRLKSSSREVSVEIDQVEESEGLYCPRVLRPVIAETKN